jgi:hypothetical protein
MRRSARKRFGGNLTPILPGPGGQRLGERGYWYLRSSLRELAVLTTDTQIRLEGNLQLAIGTTAFRFFGEAEMAAKPPSRW